MKVLLAEDTTDLNKVVCAVLEHEGYAVTPAFDGQQALDFLKQDSFDCIVLDIMMPKKNGIEVLGELRRRGLVTPVLMLTAKAEVDDRVAGLDAGADDYLTKPFAMKELLARVKALTRRRAEYTQNDLRYGDIVLRANTFELACENSVRLSIKEFELMQALIANPEHTLSTEYLIGHVWSREPDAQSDTLWLYISYLKRKLKAIASELAIAGDITTGFRLEGSP